MTMFQTMKGAVLIKTETDIASTDDYNEENFKIMIGPIADGTDALVDWVSDLEIDGRQVPALTYMAYGLQNGDDYYYYIEFENIDPDNAVT